MNRSIIHAPASSANIGPGFDVLALAVNLAIRVELQAAGSDGFSLEISGEGSDSLPTDRSHLIVSTAAKIAGDAIESVAWKIESNIPMARGLGSSAAAHACGVAAGILLRDGCAPQPEEVFQRLSDLEGHPDNAAACVAGGFQAGGRVGERWTHSHLAIESAPRLLTLIPAVALETVRARAALPEQYPRTDAVGNLQSLATLISGLARGDWDAVHQGCVDRLHQPYRLPLIAGLGDALESLRATPELRGGWLSGAGPTLAAFIPDPSSGAELAAEAVKVLQDAGVPCRVQILEIDPLGLRVEEMQ
jgi:homoserine kinase